MIEPSSSNIGAEKYTSRILFTRLCAPKVKGGGFSLVFIRAASRQKGFKHLFNSPPYFVDKRFGWRLINRASSNTHCPPVAGCARFIGRHM